MRYVATMSAPTVIAGILTAATVPARAQSCHQLWTERNSYYKGARLLLRAINYFGNADCCYIDEGHSPELASKCLLR